MANHNDPQELEFSLEDILNEFSDHPIAPPPADAEAEARDLSSALSSLSSLSFPPAAEDDGAEPVPQESPQEVPPQQPEQEPAVTQALSQPEHPELEPHPVMDTDTHRFTSMSQETAPEPSLDDTIVAPSLTEEAPAQEPQEAEEKPFIPAPTVFTPRSRLRELKKKLVAGPEKRYYALSEIGVGKLQMAILVCVLLVALCAGITAAFAVGQVPANRLRLVIFSQVLAMLVSALMGCQLMLDSLGAIFRGRFTVNTLLTITFGVCLADAVFCLQELRVPCCAAFCLEMTAALWARYQQRTTEMARLDTMRKAVRLHGLVQTSNYYEGKTGLLQVEGEVEDFMDTYNKPSTPEKVQSIYAFVSLLLCIGIAVFAGMRHGVSMAVQILSTSLLVAVPASFFVSLTRPAAILEQRLHMVGSVLCGWQGVKALSKKAVFPLDDDDLFPRGSAKLNGVKFYGTRDSDDVVAYATSLITQAGGGLAPVFQQLLTSRSGQCHSVENFHNYGGGGIGGEVCGEPVLLGTLDFLQDMGVDIPEGTMVNQAVYTAIDGQLCAVFAISYAKMRSAAAGLVTLCGCRKLTPVMLCSDFMLTEEFLQAKFGIKTKRIAFPDGDTRAALKAIRPDPESPVLALSTREELVSIAYTVTGSRALRTASNLGVAIHLLGGILGMVIMLALAYLGNTELLIPTNILLYQLIWALPGLLITEWTRTV